MAIENCDAIRDLRSNKAALGKWIAGGWLFFFVVLAATWWAIPVGMTDAIRGPSARLSFVLSHLFCASMLLFLGFLAVGATRWQIETSDPMKNPAVGGEATTENGVRIRVHAQFLSNTTEQFVMFSAASLAATPFLTSHYLRIITLSTIAWIAGRFFFWGGYWYTASRGRPSYPRAVGLGLGLLCTLSMAALAAVGICLHFPSFSSLFGSAEAAFPSLGSEGLLLKPVGDVAGSNILPVAFFTGLMLCIAALARLPRWAPPVIPIAVLCCLGWGWVLLSGTVPIR